MLAKKVAKNPTPPSVKADEVRAGLSQLGIEEQDVAAALSWARKAE